MWYNEKANLSYYFTPMFSSASIDSFLASSSYRFKRSWVQQLQDRSEVSSYLSANARVLSKQKRAAFHDLSLIELRECRKLPEVQNNPDVNRYMRMMEVLHDGTSIGDRLKFQNMANRLEKKILHSISHDPADKVLVGAFLKVVCLFSNVRHHYGMDDMYAVNELCKII
jgi:hypothetical protein